MYTMLLILVAVSAAAYLLRKVRTRSNTQIHRINQHGSSSEHHRP